MRIVLALLTVLLTFGQASAEEGIDVGNVFRGKVTIGGRSGFLRMRVIELKDGNFKATGLGEYPYGYTASRGYPVTIQGKVIEDRLEGTIDYPNSVILDFEGTYRSRYLFGNCSNKRDFSSGTFALEKEDVSPHEILLPLSDEYSPASFIVDYDAEEFTLSNGRGKWFGTIESVDKNYGIEFTVQERSGSNVALRGKLTGYGEIMLRFDGTQDGALLKLSSRPLRFRSGSGDKMAPAQNNVVYEGRSTESIVFGNWKTENGSDSGNFVWLREKYAAPNRDENGNSIRESTKYLLRGRLQQFLDRESRELVLTKDDPESIVKKCQELRMKGRFYDSIITDAAEAQLAEWRQRSEQQDANALFLLGLSMQLGCQGEHSIEEVAEIYRRSATNGCTLAAVTLGDLILAGKWVPVDDLKAACATNRDLRGLLAANEYRMALKLNDPIAMVELAEVYDHIGSEYRNIAWWLRVRATQLGSSSAMNRLGLRNSSRSMEAEAWYCDAINGGCHNALYNLGRHLNSENYREEDAVHAFELAAGLGNTAAWYELGRIYLVSKGRWHDPKMARKYFEKAAEANFAPAIRQIGICQRDGIAMSVNRTEAIKSFTKAAELGDMTAYADLIMMYADGQISTFDIPKVKNQLKVAADTRDPAAIFCLGLIAQYGIDEETNLNEARNHFYKARTLGYLPAGEKFNEDGIRPPEWAPLMNMGMYRHQNFFYTPPSVPAGAQASQASADAVREYRAKIFSEIPFVGPGPY